jgi:hypothetical protein
MGIDKGCRLLCLENEDIYAYTVGLSENSKTEHAFSAYIRWFDPDEESPKRKK